MDLFLNSTSPYARVVRIVAVEKGLIEGISVRWCDPWADDQSLLEANPAGRVPALVTNDGVSLSESLLIAHYLDAQGHGPSLRPDDLAVEVLHLCGLGQGLIDASFNTIIARKHQGSEADISILGRRRLAAIERTLQALETEAASGAAFKNMTLGSIVIAVALDYLAFRMPELRWQMRFPRLQTWHARTTDRESFFCTGFE
ncbi:glutathione S-transferase family protein [Marinobacter salicampi]|uniref:glutathione S-transferase family protein n=1 Tax=Marinobacter salicampi TaxID=435907 RepID=UPI00140B7ACA|nr:glutathione S-transferase N-terminal domain-containing protein [Marinobacter salicampi]